MKDLSKECLINVMSCEALYRIRDMLIWKRACIEKIQEKYSEVLCYQGCDINSKLYWKKHYLERYLVYLDSKVVDNDEERITEITNYYRSLYQEI